jgi:hypothetical protein
LITDADRLPPVQLPTSNLLLQVVVNHELRSYLMDLFGTRAFLQAVPLNSGDFHQGQKLL